MQGFSAFREAGEHPFSLAVELETRSGAFSVFSSVFNVTVKYVRHEIRTLDATDRNAFFAALYTMYTTTDAEGVSLYGIKFKSGEQLVRKHLYGAAKRDCDHWHDDARTTASRRRDIFSR